MIAVAKIVSKEASVMEFKKVEWRNGVKRMISEISDPCDDPFADGVKWKKVTLPQLEDLGTFFKAKDVQALEAIYRDYHEMVPSEIEAIVGKAVPVSEG